MTTLQSRPTATTAFPHDQPTPQSPPFSMSGYNGYSNTMTEKRPHSPNLTPPSFGSGVATQRQTMSGSNPMLTPRSNGPLKDGDGDVVMDAEDVGSPFKRRRTSGSFDGSSVPHPPATLPTAPPSEHAVAAPRKALQELLDKDKYLGPFHYVCSKEYKPQEPGVQPNLLKLYDMKPIVDKVARKDEHGNKINKLRKSYQGMIKDLNGWKAVEAKTPIVPPPINPDTGLPMRPTNHTLGELLAWPEEEWQNQRVHGKELDSGALNVDKLRRVVGTWKEKKIPGWNEPMAQQYGVQDVFFPKPQKTGLLPSAASPGRPQSSFGAPSPRPNGVGMGAAPGMNGEDLRPRRKKRRRYDDDSFEGYNETFEGDGGERGGNNGGNAGGGTWQGGDPERKTKKRKKSSVAAPSPSGFPTSHTPIPPPSIGQGVGLYGR